MPDVAKTLPYQIPEIKLTRGDANDVGALYKAIQDWSKDLANYLRRISASVNLEHRGGFAEVIGYEYAGPSSGGTIAASAGKSALLLEPATDLASVTVVLPQGQSDGQQWKVLSSRNITQVNLIGTAGQLLKVSTISLGANAGAQGFLFRQANNTWYVS